MLLTQLKTLFPSFTPTGWKNCVDAVALTPNPITDKPQVWLPSRLQPLKRLHVSHVARLIASILGRTNRLSGLGHLQHVSQWVGWRREREGEAGARTQLNLPQHLLLQQGLFLLDPLTCDPKFRSLTCRTGQQRKQYVLKEVWWLFIEVYYSLLIYWHPH